MDNTVALITQAFSGKVMDLSGDTAPVPDGQAAPRTIHPAEVTLVSSAVAEHGNDNNQPVHFIDWMRHVDLFPHAVPITTALSLSQAHCSCVFFLQSGWRAQAQAPAMAH